MPRACLHTPAFHLRLPGPRVEVSCSQAPPPPQGQSLESVLSPLRWPTENYKGPQNLPTDLMTFEMDFQELMDLHAVLARYPETVPKFHSYCTLHFFSLAGHTSALKHLNLYGQPWRRRRGSGPPLPSM